jgi:hypothetical protein
MMNTSLPPPINNDSDALQARPPLAPITNVTPSTNNDGKQDHPKNTTNKIKTMKASSPHPCSLNVLPSPKYKWSATTHPIRGLSSGFLGYHIFYKHFYFHQGRVLHTNAFAPSNTASTVGDGSNPQGSTELDKEIGANCAMTKDDHVLFAMLVLGLWPGKTHGTQRSNGSFVKMLLEDFVSLTNPTAVFPLNKPSDRKALARILARFSILLLGADALTPEIITQVWGQNKIVRTNLGGPHGDLALIRRRLILLASVANNVFHLWLTTSFNNGIIFPPDTLKFLLPRVCNILRLIQHNTSAIYVCERLPPGKEQINILKHNLRHHPTNPRSSNFTNIIASWYRDLLLSGDHSDDTTGSNNHIFAAFGLYDTQHK